MSDQDYLTSKTKVQWTFSSEMAEVLGHLDGLANFAYEQGYHEIGYCPVRKVSAEIERLQTKLLAAEQLAVRQGNEIRKLRLPPPPSDALNWRHPKIQALIASEARLKIERDMIAQLIDDPNADLYGLSDYETDLTEKLRARAAAPPSDALDAERYRWLRDQRRWLFNLPPTPGISLRWENYIAGGNEWIDKAIDDARGAVTKPAVDLVAGYDKKMNRAVDSGWDAPAMAMLPNDHHPGPRCSCRECLGRYPVETPVRLTANEERSFSKVFENSPRRIPDEKNSLPLCDCDTDTGCKEYRQDKFRCAKEEAERAAPETSGPASLVGALQDVVHADPGPVRAGRSVRSGEKSGSNV